MPGGSKKARRLNVGCGTDIREGFVNLDSVALPGVDVVHDIGNPPLPFEDGSFDEVICQDVLEHLDLVPALRELHRVMAPGGRLWVRSPHFSSWLYYADPTHRTPFSILTLVFFVKWSHRNYYFDFAFTDRVDARITFTKSWGQPWNWLMEPLVNVHPKMQTWYESTFLARLFPAMNIEVTLVR